jgi:hypothetical protein
MNCHCENPLRLAGLSMCQAILASWIVLDETWILWLKSNHNVQCTPNCSVAQTFLNHYAAGCPIPYNISQPLLRLKLATMKDVCYDQHESNNFRWPKSTTNVWRLKLKPQSGSLGCDNLWIWVRLICRWLHPFHWLWCSALLRLITIRIIMKAPSPTLFKLICKSPHTSCALYFRQGW